MAISQDRVSGTNSLLTVQEGKGGHRHEIRFRELLKAKKMRTLFSFGGSETPDVDEAWQFILKRVSLAKSVRFLKQDREKECLCHKIIRFARFPILSNKEVIETH